MNFTEIELDKALKYTQSNKMNFGCMISEFGCGDLKII